MVTNSLWPDDDMQVIELGHQFREVSCCLFHYQYHDCWFPGPVASTGHQQPWYWWNNDDLLSIEPLEAWFIEIQNFSFMKSAFENVICKYWPFCVALIVGWWCHMPSSLQWRHNGHGNVSNHQPHDCLLNRLYRRRSKKTSKLCATGLCAGNSPGTGEFPAQMASNAENVSIWWRHHVELGPQSTVAQVMACCLMAPNY